MKAYVVSLGAGALAGVLYGILGVRSPAPPAIGLLGLLLGEQIVPVARRVIGGRPLTMEWVKRECVPGITGTPPPPGRADAPAQDDETTTRQGRGNP